MELEIGMYVRTDNGIIGKIYEKIGDMFTYKDNNRDYITYGLLHTEIIKSSYNIIDLIEVGDYVNGGQVREKTKEYIRISGGKHLWEYLEKEEDIKSIVTKEQFESMSYKVDDAK